MIELMTSSFYHKILLQLWKYPRHMLVIFIFIINTAADGNMNMLQILE